MLISLDYRDARPIYEQVKDRLRRLILSGVIAEGEKLPSVRELSSQLAVNPNTIQRAYRELEAEGCLYSVPAKGSFAAELSALKRTRREELLGLLARTAAELRILGVPEEDIRKGIGGKEA